MLDATEASPERIDGVVFGRGDAESGNRLRAALSKQLSEAFPGCLVIVRVDWAPSVKKSRGTLGAQLALTTSSGATLGADFGRDGGRSVDALCSKLVEALKERHTKAGGGVDDQTADQLALCMAFASGLLSSTTVFSSCAHVETVMHFAARFTGAAYELTGEGESVVLTCTPKTLSIINLGGEPVAGCSIREEGLRAAALPGRVAAAYAMTLDAGPRAHERVGHVDQSVFGVARAPGRTAASHASHRPGRCSKYEPHASRRQTKRGRSGAGTLRDAPRCSPHNRQRWPHRQPERVMTPARRRRRDAMSGNGAAVDVRRRRRSRAAARTFLRAGARAEVHHHGHKPTRPRFIGCGASAASGSKPARAV